MNMTMKNILMRIIFHLIHLKIQQQHHLVLQKRFQLGQIYLQPLKESTETTHTTEMSTAESTKHYLR